MRPILNAFLLTVSFLTMRAFAADTLISNQFLLGFDTAILNSPAHETITLSNVGVPPISNFSLTISGPNANDFSATTNCSTLASTASCTITVTFTPTAYGVRSATLAVTSTGTAAPLAIALQGNGQLPDDNGFEIVETPFGPFPVGQSITITVRLLYLSRGGYIETSEISSITIEGQAASDYQPLPIQGTPFCDTECYIDVTFTPSAFGPRPATLVIVTAVGTVRVPLAGSGSNIIPPVQASLTASSLNFTPQGLTSSSPTRFTTVTSTGLNSLAVNSITLTGPAASDYSVIQDCTDGSSLPDYLYCEIGVTFTPTAAGVRAATLNINDNSATGLDTVALSGTGVASSAKLLVGNATPVISYLYSQFPSVAAAFGTAPSTDFGDSQIGVSKTLVNLITNDGATAENIAISISGVNAADFTLNPNGNGADCAASSALMPNAACNSAIAFKSSAAGLRTATLTITDTTSGIFNSYALTGNGIQGIKKLVFVENPPYGTRGFGAQPIGESSFGRTLRVANAGTLPLTLTGSYFSGSNQPDFQATGYQCSSGTATLQPADTCDFSTTFRPIGEGYRTAAFNVFYDNGTDGVLSIPVTGAAYPNYYFQAADFSFVRLGTQSQQVFGPQLKNFGNGLVNLKQLIVSGPNAADFSIAGTACSSVLRPDDYCTANLEFTPSVQGPEIAYITLVNDSPFGNAVFALYGYGEAPPTAEVYASPAALHFDNPIQAYHALDLFSSSGSPLQVLETLVQGAQANLFSVAQTYCSPDTIADFDTCLIVVDYNSLSDRTATANLHIVTNQSTLDVPLLANQNAATPQLIASPPINFFVAYGTYTTQIVNFTQIGPSPLSLTVGNPAFSGQVAAELSAGQLSCDVLQNCSLPITLNSIGYVGLIGANLNLLSGSTKLSIPINGSVGAAGPFPLSIGRK